MGNVQQAQKAKENTNGQYIYSDTNLMQIQYSQRTSLLITQQTARARDFTVTQEHNENIMSNS